jgi:hypothetical protein
MTLSSRFSLLNMLAIIVIAFAGIALLSGCSGGATGSTNVEQLSEMVVDVSRADNDSPMYVKFWLNEENGPGDQPMRIKGQFEVTEGVSEQYPMGMMTAYIIGRQLVEDVETGVKIPTGTQNTMKTAMNCTMPWSNSTSGTVLGVMRFKPGCPWVNSM